MILYKEDLFGLGANTYGSDEEMTCFEFEYGPGLSVNLIFLREILKLWGEDYKITDKYDVDADYEYSPIYDICLVCETNLPWSVYQEELDRMRNETIEKKDERDKK